jgi:hypothetical protein
VSASHVISEHPRTACAFQRTHGDLSTVRNGKIARGEYLDRPDALRAVAKR